MPCSCHNVLKNNNNFYTNIIKSRDREVINVISYVISEERKLEDIERPLFVQLNWGKDDREGRFLLKSQQIKTNVSNLNTMYCQVNTHALINVHHLFEADLQYMYSFITIQNR